MSKIKVAYCFLGHTVYNIHHYCIIIVVMQSLKLIDV